jgi:hypothetical protein
MSKHSYRRYLAKKNSPHNVHVMSKDEAKVMRRIQAQTGLTEDEVRQQKKYRCQLSKSQCKEKHGKTREQQARITLMKQATRKLGLAKRHPLVIEEYKRLWKESQFASWCSVNWFSFHFSMYPLP